MRRIVLRYRENSMPRFISFSVAVLLAQSSAADELDIIGTYRLVSSERVIVATGQTEDSFGSNPSGFITYGRDGRMMVIIVRSDRPKPEAVDRMTDQQRAELLRSMLAYGGRYEIHGNQIEHHIDISWNEVWTGTTVVREVKKEGDRLIYTTKPAPFSSDGKVSITKLVWEKVK
jgi:lipocalin-like protein